VFLVVGAAAVLVPFPERQGVTGLLVELPRGLTVGVLALMMLRGLAGRADAGRPASSATQVRTPVVAG
jgi:hypothetical protein